MPLYEFKCTLCGTINEFIVDISNLYKVNKKNKNLDSLNLECNRCGNTTFVKIISAHGKMSSNWSKWNHRPDKVETKKCLNLKNSKIK